jgi:flagellar hook-length control protein FliK
MGIAPQIAPKPDIPAPSADAGPKFSDTLKTAEAAEPAVTRPTKYDGQKADLERTEFSDDGPDIDDDAPEVTAVLASTAAPPQTFAPVIVTAEPDTVQAALPDSVSVLEGQTNDWSLPLPIDASQFERLDTARMPTDTPAEPTAILSASEPCPPENVNAIPETVSTEPVNTENAAAETALPVTGTRIARQPAEVPDTQPAEVSDVNTQTDTVPVAAAPVAEPEARSGANSDKSSEERDPDKPTAAKASAPELLAHPEIVGEHVAGTEALRSQAETAPPAPVAREDLVPAMIERLEVMTQGTEKTMTLELKPEFLGKVTMTLVSAENGVSVKILADSPDVRSVINTEIAGIIERMNDRGVKLQSVELAYTGANASDYASGNQPRQSGGQSGRGRRNTAQIQGISTSAYSASPMLVYESSLASLPDDDYEAMEYTA